MLVEIPPKMSVSGFMGYLKGKSILMIYEQFGDLRFKYRNREFCCRGYYVDTAGKNAAKSVFGNFSSYSYKKACGQKKTVRGSKNSRRLSNGTPAI